MLYKLKKKREIAFYEASITWILKSVIKRKKITGQSLP